MNAAQRKAAAGLLGLTMEQAIVAARYRKSAADVRARLLYVRERVALIGWDGGEALEDVRRATDLRLRKWKP